jgi:hypothetical protein
MSGRSSPTRIFKIENLHEQRSDRVSMDTRTDNLEARSCSQGQII